MQSGMPDCISYICLPCASVEADAAVVICFYKRTQFWRSRVSSRMSVLSLLALLPV